MIDDKLFITLWIFSCLIVLPLLFVFIKNLFFNNMPFKYSYIKNQYGKPIQSFNVRIVLMGGVLIRGFGAKVDIYPDFVSISTFGRALIIKNYNCMKLTSSFVSQMDFDDGKSKISIILSKKQYEIFKQLIEN